MIDILPMLWVRDLMGHVSYIFLSKVNFSYFAARVTSLLLGLCCAIITLEDWPALYRRYLLTLEITTQSFYGLAH